MNIKYVFEPFRMFGHIILGLTHSPLEDPEPTCAWRGQDIKFSEKCSKKATDWFIW